MSRVKSIVILSTLKLFDKHLSIVLLADVLNIKQLVIYITLSHSVNRCTRTGIRRHLG